MNLSLALNNLTRSASAHAPEILLVAGTVSFIGTIVTACKATIKAKELVENAKKEIEIIENTVEECEDEQYTQEDAKIAKRTVYLETGWAMIKKYAIPAVLAVATIACFYKGHGIMVRRNVALAGALTSTAALFKDYRERVIEAYGEEVDKDLLHGASEVEVWEDDGNGNETHEKFKVVDGKNTLFTYYIDMNSPIVVDNGSTFEGLCWYRDGVDSAMNKILCSRRRDSKPGIMALNEVLCRYNVLPNDEEALVCGWTSDDTIHTEITPVKFSKHGEIVDGFALDFNVRGSIYKVSKR